VDEIKKGYHYEKEPSLEEIFCEMQMDKKEEEKWIYR
jgi:hypothetical protein